MTLETTHGNLLAGEFDLLHSLLKSYVNQCMCVTSPRSSLKLTKSHRFESRSAAVMVLNIFNADVAQFIEGPEIDTQCANTNTYSASTIQ